MRYWINLKNISRIELFLTKKMGHRTSVLSDAILLKNVIKDTFLVQDTYF